MPQNKPLAHLVVRRLSDHAEVHRVALHTLNERTVEKTMMGMLRNMSDDYFVDDSEVDAARAAASAVVAS